eukprot:6485029-Amphidinium_carterae.1
MLRNSNLRGTIPRYLFRSYDHRGYSVSMSNCDLCGTMPTVPGTVGFMALFATNLQGHMPEMHLLPRLSGYAENGQRTQSS